MNKQRRVKTHYGKPKTTNFNPKIIQNENTILELKNKL
jgi:hypothetical protein